MNDLSLLRYRDEQDKCYGITGMAISLFVFDTEKYLMSISLDDNDIDCIRFTPDFYFSGNPRVSARVAWNLLVERFQKLTGLAISNVMCRNIIKDEKELTRDHYNTMLDMFIDEGISACELEREEIRTIFDKNYEYLSRVFHHTAIQRIARDFADNLSSHRLMSRSDIMESLGELLQ